MIKNFIIILLLGFISYQQPSLPRQAELKVTANAYATLVLGTARLPVPLGRLPDIRGYVSKPLQLKD